MRIRALIVDDEPHAREGIKIRLKKFPSVEVVGECDSGSEAVASIRVLRPDLLFLDIQMPDMDGFEVLAKTPLDLLPVVIFVTAYDDYALKAFEFHALDYLLKPISDDRFIQAMDLALEQVKRKSLGEYARKLKETVSDYLSSAENRERLPGQVNDTGPFIDRLVIKEREQVTFIPVAEIDWLEAAGDYVYVHSDAHRHLIRQTLSSLEKRIDPKKFVRIHRSTIVNVEKIASLRGSDHGDFAVQMKSGERLKLSRSFRAHFEEVIGNSL